jgi:hypothetical protein
MVKLLCVFVFVMGNRITETMRKQRQINLYFANHPLKIKQKIIIINWRDLAISEKVGPSTDTFFLLYFFYFVFFYLFIYLFIFFFFFFFVFV